MSDILTMDLNLLLNLEKEKVEQIERKARAIKASQMKEQNTQRTIRNKI
jgi:hypothetical protein